MLQRRWYVTADDEAIDGPFVFRFIAEAHATSHRAHAAQLARHEGIPMPEVDVVEEIRSARPLDLS